jgi:ATP-dependent metalloprotease FtsH
MIKSKAPKSGQTKSRKFVNKLPRRPKPNWKSNLILYILLGLIAGSIFLSIKSSLPVYEQIPLSQVLQDTKEDQVEKIAVDGNRLTITYKNGEIFESRKEPVDSMREILQKENIDPTKVTLDIKPDSNVPWLDLISTIGIPVGFIIFFIFLFRQARGAQDSLFTFGQSRAKRFGRKMSKINFNDVAGVEEAKKEVAEIIDFLKNPGKYRKMGARTPKGVLLIGPSGCGKTLLARAVAGEASVPFFSMAGSEFMEMLVGVGASVTGETPILISDDEGVSLQEIGPYIDQFYQGTDEGKIVPVFGTHTLGFEKKITGFWGSRSSQSPVFAHSAWKKLTGVYRHKVNEIFEIEFLGGTLRTTGDHSVFIRTHGSIKPKRVDLLKPGEVLVDLPMKTRRWDPEEKTTLHTLRRHQFPESTALVFDVWNEDEEMQETYWLALSTEDVLTQNQAAQLLGTSQATIGNWRRGIHLPQLLSRKLVKINLPNQILPSLELMKLFGYYTAEGRGTNGLEFTFGAHEKEYQLDCAKAVKKVFGIDPKLERTETNSTRLKYYSKHLGRFFSQYCGEGSHKKHVPEFMWFMPREFFLAYLKGYTNGDGYTAKSGKLSMSSVSHQLIRELAWLCNMHGIGVGIKHEIHPPGRIINSKPLPATEVWTLIIGKTSHPFLDQKIEQPFQVKRAIIKKITKKPFEGYVYDLCGVENEAFFGGEKPILLHNSRVRDLFQTAKKNAPSVIFIDEIDSIGRQRGAVMVGSHGEQEQTLNQILTEMDGFTPNDACIVLAATNRPDILDPALIRPGRFDRRIILDMPDLEERKAILKVHAKGKPITKPFDWNKVAKRTVGFSGADLENMLNEAAILAAREGSKKITSEHIEEAATKVKLGPEKKRFQTDEDRKLTAYHEAGHAVVSYFLPHTDPVHRVSIVSRGLALGFTLIPPARDRYNETKTRLLETITTLLGGRAAEKLVFKELTVGAASDIEQATAIARRMVVEYGMSELGPISLGQKGQFRFLSQDWYEPSQVSPEMAAKVDKQVQKIIKESLAQATKTLKKNRSKLDIIANRLLEVETIEGEEFEKMMGKK